MLATPEESLLEEGGGSAAGQLARCLDAVAQSAQIPGKRAAGKHWRSVWITESTAWTKPDCDAMRSSGTLRCRSRHLLVARPASGAVRGLPESIGRYLS